MKVIVFDETENFILRGVVANVEPGERPQAVMEYIEANLDNPTLKGTSEGELLLSTLGQLYDKLLTYDEYELISILQGEFKSFLFDETVYIPYAKEDLIDDIGKKEFNRLFERPKKQRKKRSLGKV